MSMFLIIYFSIVVVLMIVNWYNGGTDALFERTGMAILWPLFIVFGICIVLVDLFKIGTKL